MLASRAHACADHRAYYERTACLTTKHVAQLGSLVEDLIPADAVEINKHQFGYWTHTCSSGADRRANEPGLSDGRIEDAIAPKFLDQPLRDTKHATPGLVVLQVIDSCSACDILTQ